MILLISRLNLCTGASTAKPSVLVLGHEALCFPAQWTAPVNQFHYMFCHEDIKDSEGIFLHTSNLSLDDLGLMQILYQFGYCRAAILDKEEILPQVFRVLFLDVVQQPTTEPGRIKKPLPWPAPSHHGRLNRPFFDPGRHLEGDKDFLIRLGITMIDIDAFFKSGDDILCRDPTGLELPETTKQVMLISDTTDLALFDRLIIYTDGSSIPLHRHRPAAWNEENGNGDTWAYVVLGERFVDQQQVVEVIGWLTHPVRYDPHCPSFLGSTYVGSLGAEREAMTWAALWRLAQNVDTPTLFRTDSWTTAMQAQGQIGTADVEASFTSLRSCFQALEVALPNRLQVEHTPGHCGDPYNDFADWLAREERSRSFYGKRQAISLDLWRPFLPYMWMLFSQTDGLPSWSSQGFHVPPPQLPSPLATPVCEETTLISDLAAKIDISLASANIGSMYNGEWGHAGKLDYLRTQFKLLCLNFLGLQEARTPELFSRTDRILRFASGAHHGHHSIELWVNLEQAYAVTDDGANFFCTTPFRCCTQRPSLLACSCGHGVGRFLDPCSTRTTERSTSLRTTNVVGSFDADYCSLSTDGSPFCPLGCKCGSRVCGPCLSISHHWWSYFEYPIAENILAGREYLPTLHIILP